MVMGELSRARLQSIRRKLGRAVCHLCIGIATLTLVRQGAELSDADIRDIYACAEDETAMLEECFRRWITGPAIGFGDAAYAHLVRILGVEHLETVGIMCRDGRGEPLSWCASDVLAG